MRARGWQMAACGAFLTVLMGYGIVWSAEEIRRAGSPRDPWPLFLLLGLGVAFGLAGLWAGISQVRTGRRNRAAFAIAIGFAVALAAVGAAIQALT